jgi:hypothetical protein
MYCGAAVETSIDNFKALLGDGHQHCCLISNRPSTTVSYLKAAAASIPVYSHTWVLDMFDKVTFLPLVYYFS